MKNRWAVKHKFHAKQCEFDGIKFPSKKEGRYYLKLKALKESGELLFFLRQCPLHLTGNIRYVIDFIEFWKDGNVIFTEVKGYMTESARLKIRQAEDLYNIAINVV